MGLVLASLWVIVLIAAVASTIYREIDGPTISSTTAENLNLTKINSTLNENLDSARISNNRLNAELTDSRMEYVDLMWRIESYLSTTPVIRVQIGP